MDDADPRDDVPSGTNALAGGATRCTGIPNAEKVSVETVVVGPRRRPAKTVGSFTPRDRRIVPQRSFEG
jgi:hypothetical protein